MKDHLRSQANISWLAPTAAYIYIALYSIGVGPIISFIMVEILPDDVRGMASTLAICGNWTFAFIVTLSMEPLKDSIQFYGIFWLFAFCIVLIFMLVLFFVPETKGKSFEEVEVFFNKGKHVVLPSPTGDKVWEMKPVAVV